MAFIVPIVEGHGEVRALPALLHRLAVGAPTPLYVNPPFRVRAGSFFNDLDYFNRYVEAAAIKAAVGRGTVLILLDNEDDCSATLGPRLLQQALAVRADVACIVALAVREYESWFIHAIRSLEGLHGIGQVEPPLDPDGFRDAKGWLSRQMRYAYDPVQHQADFTRQMDLEAAQRSPSFHRLCERMRPVLFAPDAGQ